MTTRTVRILMIFVLLVAVGASMGVDRSAAAGPVTPPALPVAADPQVRAIKQAVLSRSQGRVAAAVETPTPSVPGMSLLGKWPAVALPQNQPLGAEGLQVGQVRFVNPGVPPTPSTQPAPIAKIRPDEAISAAGGPPNPYYSVETFTLSDGTRVDEMMINGPPNPPPGYERERVPVASSALNRPGVASTLSVPAYDWVFGCSAVSASMIGAYFDRNGFPNIYTGPTNGGVMPMDNSGWPTWTDSEGKAYPGNPLAASHRGSDGRTTRGSIDDYWVKSNSTAQDPYITGGWAQHTWSDAFGDYMKTSQSAYDNPDGGTSFYATASRLTCAAMEAGGVASVDGTYGRKLFYEARGYTVGDCYSQKTDNNGGGFTYANYKALIDAGYPVLLNLAGHSIVGVGYADPSTVYIHDTWDYETHQMPWGGSYSGKLLLSVSVVNPIGGSVVPTETPHPGGSALVNGDFEQGNGVGWSESSALGYDLIGDWGFAHGGSWFAALGGDDNETAELAQTVTVPTSGALTFWHWITSEDTCGNDVGQVLIDSAVVKQFDLCSTNSASDYKQETISLAAYAGRSVKLAFRATTNASGWSIWFLDDVAMTGDSVTPTETPDPNKIYTISGRVSDAGGAGVPAVTVADNHGHSVTTDANGSYTISGLTKAGTYFVTPAKSGCTFTPSMLSPTVPPNATGQNFTANCGTATYALSGQVTAAAGGALSGVTISDGAGHSATTDASGNYTLSGLAAGSYTVTPAKSGCTFAPTSQSASLPPSATGKNFVGSCTVVPTPTPWGTPPAVYSIAGQVTANGAGLAGVTISDGAGHSATTDASGSYMFSSLAAGAYTVTPAKSGCTFSPASLSVSLPPNATGKNFTASCPVGGTRVKILPASLSANLGGTFNVTLSVEGVTELAAYEAKLTYNPAIVQVTAVNQGPFLSSTGRSEMPVATVIDNVAGRAEFGAASLGTKAYPSGGGVLTTITFQAKAVGVSALHLESVLLSDPSFRAIAVSPEDGQARVTNCFGDFNGDGQVNIFDLQMAAARWNCHTGQACYDAQFDVIPEGAPDGAIDIRDIQRIAAAWNTTCGGQARQPAIGALEPVQVVAVSLGLRPVSTQIAAGQVFSQTIRLQDVSDLGAFQADVTYDPAVVQAEGVTQGAFLGSTGRSVLAPPPAIDNVTGRVRWGAGSFGAPAGPTGSGDVAIIRFRALGTGKTTLSFEHVLLANSQSQPLALGSVAGSQVTVGGAPRRTYLPLITK